MEIIRGKLNGFCYGVKRAVDGAMKMSNGYCLGELVHNKQVVESLENKNIKIIDSLDEVDNNTTVIVRAHGVSKNIYEEAEKRNITLVDYTCPFVKKIHDICMEYRDNDYYIFVVGIENHPETIGNISYCGDNYSLITGIEKIDEAISNYKNSKLNKSMVIFQTTYNTILANEIIEYLDNNINGELVVKNTICLSTEERQKNAKELAKEVDMMIIVGGKNSSNTKKLFDISKIDCNNVISVETKEDLINIEFSKVRKLGVISGASTPNEIVEDIIKYIEEK